MSDQIPLHELNKHLFAALLPGTHAIQPVAAKGKKAKVIDIELTELTADLANEHTTE